jgi:hypothetical protein
MPTASDSLRGLMEKWFGDPIDESGPLAFLKAHGYTEFANGMLRPPVPAHTWTREELACVQFLMDEWDFDIEIEPTVSYAY